MIKWSPQYAPPRVFVFMGVSGSGKSTLGLAWAEMTGLPFYDGDDYHPPANIDKMSQGVPLTDHDRSAWLEALHELITQALGRGTGAILACSALKRAYRLILGKGVECQLTFVYLRGSKELILERLRQRKDHFMPAGLLDSQFEDLEEPGNALVLDIRLSTAENLAELNRQLTMVFPG